MKTTQRKGKAAFTLIELMAVITIIVILAGLVVGGLGFVNERQAKEKARVQIALLSKAIEDYKLDIGQYPGDAANTPTGGTGVTGQLYTALFFEGYDFGTKNPPPDPWEKTISSVKVPKATKIYLADLNPLTTQQGWVQKPTTINANSKPPSTVTGGIKDPWGREYLFRKGTNAQNPDFDLWSVGKDGLTNNDPKHKDSLDDIRNF